MYTVYSVRRKEVKEMKRYKVGVQKDGTVKYYFIRDVETLELSLFPTKYLTHLTRANRSPNTIRRSAFAICYYLEYMDEKQMEIEDVYQMDFETQYVHFSDYLTWLKLGKHKENTKKLPDNGTCNAYLKDVFRFYLFGTTDRAGGAVIGFILQSDDCSKLGRSEKDTAF